MNYQYHLESTWYKNNQRLRNYDNDWSRKKIDDSIAPEHYGTVNFPERVWSIPSLIGPSKMIAGCYDNAIHCIDMDTLQPLWRFHVNGPIYSSPAVLSDGSFVIGSEDGFLRRIDSDGQGIWEFQAKGPFHSTPTVDKHQGVVFGGSYDHAMYALDLTTGELRWKVELDPDVEEDVYSSPALTADGGIIFGTGNRLILLDSSGKEMWSISAEGRFVGSAALDYASGNGVVGSGKCGRIYIFNIKSGEVVSMHQTNNQVVSSPCLGFDGVASVGSNDGNIYGIDIASGRMVWTCTIGHEFRWTPFTTSQSGRNIFVTRDEKLYCVEGGVQVWTLSMGGGAHSAPLLTPDGRLVVGSHRNAVHFFQWN